VALFESDVVAGLEAEVLLAVLGIFVRNNPLLRQDAAFITPRILMDRLDEYGIAS